MIKKCGCKSFIYFRVNSIEINSCSEAHCPHEMLEEKFALKWIYLSCGIFFFGCLVGISVFVFRSFDFYIRVLFGIRREKKKRNNYIMRLKCKYSNRDMSNAEPENFSVWYTSASLLSSKSVQVNGNDMCNMIVDNENEYTAPNANTKWQQQQERQRWTERAKHTVQFTVEKKTTHTFQSNQIWWRRRSC